MTSKPYAGHLEDPMLKAIQNHVRKDEPKSVEERLKDLEVYSSRILKAFNEVVAQCDQQLLELHNRIERLEGKISLDKIEALVSGKPFMQSRQMGKKAKQDWLEGKWSGDPSGCICPTDAVTQCPVCNEQEDQVSHP